MSILLRKECQSALDAAGLEMLHVDVLNKTLALVGECGQTIMLISGIKFLNNTPKVKELEYAKELFLKFLDKHKEKIIDHIKLKKEFKEISQPVLSKNWNGGYNGGVTIKIASNFAISINDKLEITQISCSAQGRTLSEIEKAYNDNIEEVKTYFATFKKYNELNQKVNVSRQEIATCNI